MMSGQPSPLCTFSEYEKNGYDEESFRDFLNTDYVQSVQSQSVHLLSSDHHDNFGSTNITSDDQSDTYSVSSISSSFNIKSSGTTEKNKRRYQPGMNIVKNNTVDFLSTSSSPLARYGLTIDEKQWIGAIISGAHSDFVPLIMNFQSNNMFNSERFLGRSWPSTGLSGNGPHIPSFLDLPWKELLTPFFLWSRQQGLHNVAPLRNMVSFFVVGSFFYGPGRWGRLLGTIPFLDQIFIGFPATLPVFDKGPRVRTQQASLPSTDTDEVFHLRAKTDSLYREIVNLTADNLRLKKHAGRADVNLKACEESLKLVRSDLKRMNDLYDEKTHSFNSLDKRYDSCRSQLRNKKSEITKFQKDMKDSASKIIELDGVIKTIQKELEEEKSRPHLEDTCLRNEFANYRTSMEQKLVNQQRIITDLEQRIAQEGKEKSKMEASLNVVQKFRSNYFDLKTRQIEEFYEIPQEQRSTRKGIVFSILDVRAFAHDELVKKSYRNLSILFHPDKLPPDLEQSGNTIFQGIREAYEILFPKPPQD